MSKDLLVYAKTKNELIYELQQIPGNPIVVMSKDTEGNGFSPFCEAGDGGVYVPDTTYSGEYYNVEDAEKYGTGGVPVIVLWPRN